VRLKKKKEFGPQHFTLLSFCWWLQRVVEERTAAAERASEGVRGDVDRQLEGSQAAMEGLRQLVGRWLLLYLLHFFARI
jgi:hypothetical protein